MKIQRFCAVCNKEFQTTPGVLRKKNGGTFCSSKCQLVGRARKHGHGGRTSLTRSRTYVTWNKMVDRCTNHNSKNFKLYGGRGVTVCSKWLSFEEFFNDMGERPLGMSIDRIDPDMGYFKDNCRWATQKEQCSHLRTNHKINFMGEIICLAELVRRTNIPYKTLQYRLRAGWPIERLVIPASR